MTQFYRKTWGSFLSPMRQLSVQEAFLTLVTWKPVQSSFSVVHFVSLVWFAHRDVSVEYETLKAVMEPR